MKRTKLLGMVFAAMLMSTAASAVSASAALPELNPGTATGTAKLGATKFGSGITAISSSQGKGSVTGKNAKESTFSSTFEKSKDALGSNCTGSGDKTAGNVTVAGTADLRYESKAKTLVAVAFLLSPAVKLKCGTIEVEVKGCVAGNIEKASYNKKIKSFAIKLEVEKGDNKIVKVENAANTAEEACELLAKVGGLGFALSSEEGTPTLEKFEKGLGAAKDEVEILA